MKKEAYSIIFSSLTGNTKKLADAIHEVLPKDECEYFGTTEAQVPQSELLYIGFWTDKGNADKNTLDLLPKLKHRRIFYLVQLVLVAVIYIFKRFSDRSNSPLIQVMLLSESICARGKCPSLCGNAI